MKRKRKKGFTLIEMLVVLLVITALVLIFVPNLLKQSNKAKGQSDSAFQQVVDNQYVLYKHDHPDQKVDTWDDLSGYLSKKQINEAKKNKHIRAPWQ